jgi:hypothetical protein
MSDKEPVSILTASAKIHYIAIGVFAILLGVFYVYAYTEYFKSIKDVISKWKTYFSNTKKDDDINQPEDEPENETDDESDDDEKTHNEDTRSLLSPF